MNGKVIEWRPERGFGFIQPNGWKGRLFVHVTALQDSDGFLVPEETVRFEIVLDSSRGRRKAADVVVIHHDAEARAEIQAETPSLEGIEDGYCSGCGCPVLPGAPHCGACGARFPRSDGLHHRDSGEAAEEGIRADNLVALQLTEGRSYDALRSLERSLAG
ncbi:MAG: cold shock domain-containing protein [Candidatus Colwellbacteria bacterium]|nr:cold shock domain-containing protein [Candidatus Colwellbacteria bacterium]